MTDKPAFAALHVKGDPLILFNIWDAGSARAVAQAGARALATGSASVAGAQGFEDGEAIPFDLLETLVSRIAASTSAPLSVDFEGGFATEPAEVAANAARLRAAGAVGVNFEDQVVGGAGLHVAEAQTARIAALAATGLFVNARTDLFLQEPDPTRHAALVEAALARAAAYAKAGADGFFVPGLTVPALLAEICAATALPVNAMAVPGGPDATTLAGCGVARISHGPFPWRAAMTRLEAEARAAQNRAR